MNNPFDRRNGSGLQFMPFHNRCIHPTYPVELHMRAAARIEQPALFQETNDLLHHRERRCAAIQEMVANFQCCGEAARLNRRHTTKTGAAMDEENGTNRFQLSNRPFTRW